MKAVIRKIFVFVLSIALVFTINNPVSALPKNIDDDVNAAQQELENASALVREVAAELAEIRKKLPIAEAALKKARAELAVAQEKDRQAAEKLAELESQLEITQKTYDQTRSFVADVARTIYQDGPLATLEIILGATDPNDFKSILTKFITRLLERGYDIQNLTPILLQAALNIEHKTNNNKEKNSQKTLYIHWPFHPKGLQHQDIRRA